MFYPPFFILQMILSPSRMMQAQGMMGGHSNSIMGQIPNQNQLKNEMHFPSSAGGINVNFTQQAGQAGSTQVRGSKGHFCVWR